MDAFTSIFQESERYQKSPRKRAHTQAAMAPSVAVKTPVVMPPMRSTGVMIGSTAANLNFQSAARSTTSPANTVVRGSVPISVAAQMAVGQPSTIAASNNALPTRFHSNGTSAPHLFLCA